MTDPERTELGSWPSRDPAGKVQLPLELKSCLAQVESVAEGFNIVVGVVITAPDRELGVVHQQYLRSKVMLAKIASFGLAISIPGIKLHHSPSHFVLIKTLSMGRNVQSLD